MASKFGSGAEEAALKAHKDLITAGSELAQCKFASILYGDQKAF
jgi:hypothetical protein